MFGHAALSDGAADYEGARRRGRELGQTLELNAVCGIRNLHQLVSDRCIEVSGHLICPLLQDEPVQIASGRWRIRPHDGVTTGGADRVVFLRWDIDLVDSTGGHYWLRGHKLAEPGVDLWRQTTTLNVEIGRQGQATPLLAGQMSIPPRVYFDDQIRGLQVSSRVPAHDALKLKAAWLAFFGLNIGKNYVEVALRWGMRAWLGQ
jgi:hypothetical protein